MIAFVGFLIGSICTFSIVRNSVVNESTEWRYLVTVTGGLIASIIGLIV